MSDYSENAPRRRRRAGKPRSNARQKKAQGGRWMHALLRAAAALALLGGAAWSAHRLTLEWERRDGGIASLWRIEGNARARNGVVCEYGRIDCVGFKSICIPPGFKVDRIFNSGSMGRRMVEIYVRKSQSWFSVSGDYDIRVTRNFAGIASKADYEGKRLMLATYGDWANPKGEMRLDVALLVPRRVKIEIDEKLDGVESPAQDWIVSDLGDGEIARAPRHAPAGWGASVFPKEGWEPVWTWPDPFKTIDVALEASPVKKPTQP